MRRPTDDPEARELAVRSIAARLEGFIVRDDPQADVTPSLRKAAEQVADGFRYAEQELVTRDVQGEAVQLRRIVMTGPWEVVHG